MICLCRPFDGSAHRTFVATCFALVMLLGLGRVDAGVVQGLPSASMPASIQLDHRGVPMSLSSGGINKHLAMRLSRAPLALPGSADNVFAPSYLHQFEGRVQDHPDSWVRLSVISDSESLIELIDLSEHAMVHGLMWLDGQLWQISSRDSDGSTRVSPLGHSAGQLSATSQPQWRADVAIDDRRAIEIGLLIDSSYDQALNGRGLARALSIMHEVDGLFQQQLGLALLVTHTEVFADAQTDPLQAQGELSQTEKLLLASDYAVSSGLANRDLALVHVFSTGRNDEPLGLGWVDSLCNRNGSNMSLSSLHPSGTLLAAHEMAHNLGARHVEDTQCATTALGHELMWSRLHGGTRQDFTECSRADMRSSLLKSCVMQDIDVSISVDSVATLGEGRRNIVLQVSNHDPYRSARTLQSELQLPENTAILQLPAGCTLPADNTLLCQHSALAPDTSDQLQLTLIQPGGDIRGVVEARVSLAGFADSRGIDNQDQLDLSLAFTAANDAPTPAGGSSGDRPGIGASSWLLLLLLLSTPMRRTRSMRNLRVFSFRQAFTRMTQHCSS